MSARFGPYTSEVNDFLSTLLVLSSDQLTATEAVLPDGDEPAWGDAWAAVKRAVADHDLAGELDALDEAVTACVSQRLDFARWVTVWDMGAIPAAIAIAARAGLESYEFNALARPFIITGVIEPASEDDDL